MPSSDDDFGAARILTTAGRFYIVADERERSRFSNGKRVLFTKAEFMRMVPMLKMMTPFERHLYMTDIIQMKENFPDARVESARTTRIEADFQADVEDE